jgi:signal transduction histidine kinase
MASSEQSSREPAFDLGTFTSGLAHELANPLNALAMNAEVARLLIERNEGERARERLAALIADCGRCGRILHGIRRFGAGMSLDEADREPTTVAHLVNAACDQLRRDGPLPPVELHGAEARLVVDSAALQCAFEEILRNCSEAGARSVRVEVGRHDGRIRIEFIDDGAGIPPALRDKVLEPFFSTRRNDGSAGLGLTLVQQLVRANAGSLGIFPGNERGTCVRVELADAMAA